MISRKKFLMDLNHKNTIIENPFLREIHNTAFSFSVLEGYEKFSYKWILSNFIGLKYTDLITYDLPFFLRWPCFKKKTIFLLPNNNIINLMVNYINKGLYIYTEINEYFIPNRKSFNNCYFTHDILIYGYSNSQKLLFTIAYNEKRKYEKQAISYDDFLKAFNSCKTKYLLKTMVFSIDNNYNFNCLQYDKIKNDLKKYIYPSKKYLGINVYKYLENDLIRSHSNKYINMRSFRTIKEHKKILFLLSEFFVLPNEIKELLNELINDSNIIFNLSLKYNITNNEKIINSIILRLKQLKTKEIIVIKKILEFLDDF